MTIQNEWELYCEGRGEIVRDLFLVLLMIGQ